MGKHFILQEKKTQLQHFLRNLYLPYRSNTSKSNQPHDKLFWRHVKTSTSLIACETYVVVWENPGTSEVLD